MRIDGPQITGSFSLNGDRVQDLDVFATTSSLNTYTSSTDTMMGHVLTATHSLNTFTSSAGSRLSRGTDYTLAANGNIAFTSTPNGNLTAASQTLTGWHMIAVTTGAGTTTIYNNNVSVASGASTAAATTGTSDIYLMQNNTGNLGSFFFYQRALSATEIGYIWNNLKARYGL